MTRPKPGRRRQRGAIDELPSGALRVRVYAGEDPLTGKRHSLVEIIPPGPKAATLAEAARTRMLSQVDERRNPRTSATLDQLLDRYLETLDVGRTTPDVREVPGEARPPIRRSAQGQRGGRRGARLALRRAAAVSHPLHRPAWHRPPDAARARLRRTVPPAHLPAACRGDHPAHPLRAAGRLREGRPVALGRDQPCPAGVPAGRSAAGTDAAERGRGRAARRGRLGRS